MTNSRRFFAVAALVAMAGVPLLLAPAGCADAQKQLLDDTVRAYTDNLQLTRAPYCCQAAKTTHNINTITVAT